MTDVSGLNLDKYITSEDLEIRQAVRQPASLLLKIVTMALHAEHIDHQRVLLQIENILNTDMKDLPEYRQAAKVLRPLVQEARNHPSS